MLSFLFLTASLSRKEEADSHRYQLTAAKFLLDCRTRKKHLYKFIFMV